MNAVIPYENTQLVPEEPQLRSIPYDLIPTESKSLNQEWAEKTFRYAYLFGRDFGSANWGESQNKQAWIDKGLQLQAELRELGVQKAHEKIISLFREYNVFIPGSTQRPTNMDDALVVINDKNWYTENQDSKQALIHMIMYGIFRRGYNHWAVKASQDWLFNYEIRIDENESIKNVQGQNSRQKKGFVYRNLVQRASNAIADRIQKNMISNHGHYISVRNKGISCKFESKHFHHFNAYIVYPKDTLVNLMSPQDQIKKKLRDNITLALKNNITHDDITKIVHECTFDIDDQFQDFNSKYNQMHNNRYKKQIFIKLISNAQGKKPCIQNK